MDNHSKSEKLFEFEIMRAVSIILLLIAHTDVYSRYLFGIKLEPLGPYLRGFFLGAFFFMGGYFIEYSNRRRPRSFFAYIWSKFIRLYPPYWAALALFMLVLRFSLKRFDFLVYLANLQFIFSPTFVKPLLTLWYLSVVFAYYVIFGLFLRRSSRVVLVWSTIIFLGAYLLNNLYGFFDYRFFEYYFIFLAGLFLARFDGLREKLINASLFIQMALGLVGGYLFWVFGFGEYSVTSFYYLLASDIFIMSTILLGLRIFRMDFMKFQIWPLISKAAFFAYLFHRPIWAILLRVLNITDADSAMMFELIPGSIIVLIICYYLQTGYDLILRTGANLWRGVGNWWVPSSKI